MKESTVWDLAVRSANRLGTENLPLLRCEFRHAVFLSIKRWKSEGEKIAIQRPDPGRSTFSMLASLLGGSGGLSK